MYPYIIMKLSKKKIQKLYKSKNQTRKSEGKKSFKPKQNNHRSRKAGALNLRRRTLRKMKGGDPNEEGEEGEDDVEKTPEVVKAPEEKIEITEDELGAVLKDFTEANKDENKVDAIDKVTTTDDEKAKEEKIVSFNNLSTYKEFMTKLANLMLGKLNEVYNKKISDMKEELLKNIEEKVPATGAQDEPAAQDESAAATGGPEGKAAATGGPEGEAAATGGPEGKAAATGGPEGEAAATGGPEGKAAATGEAADEEE
jgi:hypothetical protein